MLFYNRKIASKWFKNAKSDVWKDKICTFLHVFIYTVVGKNGM